MSIETEFFLHGDKESNYDQGKKLGLTEEQMKIFRYTGYEVRCNIVIDTTGQAWLQRVNGTWLAEGVKI